MSERQPHNRVSIWLTLLLALLLTIVKIPQFVPWQSSIEPEWVLLVMLYWTIALPGCISVGSAAALGILLDIQRGTLFGEHVLALITVIYVAQLFHLRIRNYPILQMMLAVVGLVMLYEFLLIWIDGISGLRELTPWRWSPALTSFLIWPFVFRFLRYIRVRLEIS